MPHPDLEDRQDDLNAAAREGDLDTLRALLADADEDLLEGRYGARFLDEAPGCTTGAPHKRPLGCAAAGGQPAALEALLAAGAAVDAVNHRSETALHLAIRAGHWGCAERLIAAGAALDALACTGSLFAAAGLDCALIEKLLDLGVDPRLTDPFGQDAADLVIGLEQDALKRRIKALRLLVARWPADDPALPRHQARLEALEAEAAAKRARKGAGTLAALTAPEALADPGWADSLRAALPAAMWGEAPEGKKADRPRPRINRLRKAVLSHPAVIAHPAWGDVLQALVALSPRYAELTEDAYGEALDPADAADDEGGVVEQLAEERLSTIPDALALLALPAAVARADWPALVRATLTAHTERFGTSPVLGFGSDEADALFASPAVQAHPQAGALWDLAADVFPLDCPRPAPR